MKTIIIPAEEDNREKLRNKKNYLILENEYITGRVYTFIMIKINLLFFISSIVTAKSITIMAEQKAITNLS